MKELPQDSGTASLGQIFFSRFANLFRARARSRREFGHPGLGRFQFEPLEGRLLLSADLVGAPSFDSDVDPLVPGDIAEATVLVRNIGDAAKKGPVEIDLYASLDDVLDASDTLLDSKHQARRLWAGDSDSVELKFSLPATMQPGEYSLISVVDAENDLTESNEANNIGVTSGFSVAWMFGDVPGHGSHEALMVRDGDNTLVRFSFFGPGTGEVSVEGGEWDVRVTGTDETSLLWVHALGGGDHRVTLDDIHVTGALGGLLAPEMDLTGTLAVEGPLGAGLLIGSASDALIAAPAINGVKILGFNVGGISILGDLENSQILIGADLGADGRLGGSGADADSFGPGSIGFLGILGSVTASFVRAGQDPVNGIFDDCDDIIQGGVASRIGAIVIGGELSADSRIIAGTLPARALVDGRLVPTAGDARFKTVVTGPEVELALANDTGESADDGLTFDPTIIGSAIDPSGIVALQAGFDGSASVDILGELGADGSFSLSQADLEEIYGAPLAEGSYTLTISATDGQNNTCAHVLTFTLDATAPTVTIDQAAAQEDPTNDSPILFTVDFSEAITGFTAADVSLAGSTLSNLVATVTGSGASYTVAVTGMDGVGTVVASIGEGVAFDLAGNANTASTSTDNMVTFDNVAPTVTINQAPSQEDPTNDSPISFTVFFSELVTGFTGDDLSLAGSSLGNLVATVSGSGASYTVSVTGMNGVGTVVASIGAGAVLDLAGNFSFASTSTDNMVTFDNVAPTVTINQAPSQEDPTNDSPISFTVFFSELVTGFTGDDVSFAGSTLSNLVATVSGSGASYLVSVTGIDGVGTVVASIGAGAVLDLAGNFSFASTSTDNMVTFDNVAPTVTINQAPSQEDPTNDSPILFTVDFSEAITGFTGDDVSFAGSTLSNLVATVSGSGASYLVSVTGMDGVGTVVASIGAVAASDFAGNFSFASTSTDNMVTFDNVAPTVTINQAAGTQDPTDVGPITFAVLFSEVVTGFSGSDVGFAGSTVGGTFAASVSGSGASYAVTVTGMDGSGVLVASIPAAAAFDAAGNASSASTSIDNAVTFDNATGRPFIFIGDATVVEGNSGTTNAVFTVSLSEEASVPVSVTFSTSNSSAVSTSDYTSRFGSLTFAPGVTTQTISVQVAGDTAIESDEFFYVDLSNSVNAVIADPQGFGTIIDNDGRYGLSINDVTLFEAGNGTTEATFTVYLPNASSDPVSVNFTTRDGSAKAGSDYVSTSGTLTIAPGATQSSFTVTVLGDSEAEVTEEFSVLLSGAVNALISDPQGVATILSDDRLPRFAISDAVVLEGVGGTTNAVFNVTLSAPASVPATVDFATQDGPDSHFGADAIAPGDYTATSGTLTFAPGVTTQTILVPVAGDIESEGDEWFHVSLSNSTGGATLFDTQVEFVGEATIVNDDRPPPELSSRGGFVIEGNSGTTNALLTVFLTHASAATVTVDYETFNAGTNPATAGTDYTPVSGTLTFAPGVTSRTISVPVIGDTTSESIEDIGIRYTNEVNASVSIYSIIEIIDNDGSAPLPVLSVRGTGLAEGDSGTTDAIFTALLSKPSTVPVSFIYQTSDIPGNVSGKATAGQDYNSTSGTLTFAPGETIKTIAVPIVGDSVLENDEIFQLNVGGFVGLTQDVLGPTYVKIFDDDELLRLRVADAVVFEPTSGTSDAVFNVVLSRPPTSPVTVNYATTGTGGGSDYVATSGSLTFSPGMTTGSFVVPVLADTLTESRETFPVQLEIEGGSGGFFAFGRILDHSRTLLAIDAAMVIEGDSGARQAAFAVYLSEASAVPVTVNYATQDGSATAGGDYTATSGSLEFAPGTTRQTILVPVAGDTAPEGIETFTVRLSGEANARLVGFLGTGTILDNDRPQPLPQLRIDDVSVEEGDSGQVNAVFTVNLSAAATAPITFRYATANGTARAGTDYTAANTTLTFAAGSTSQTITIPIIADTAFEGDETFWVGFITTPTNAAVADNFGVATILNDDVDNVAPTVTINQAAGQADPTTGSPILFTVIFSEPVTDFIGGDVSFAGSTVGGTLAASVSGSGAGYVVAVTGMAGTGTMVASIGAGAVLDLAGNGSTASTSTDNMVTFDNVAPTVTIDQALGQFDPTNASPISFTVLFSDANSGAQGLGGAQQVTGSTTVTIAPAMLASTVVDAAPEASLLTDEQLESMVHAGIEIWATALGFDSTYVEALDAVSLVIADLPDALLASTDGSTIFIDLDAAGHGWFVDTTPPLNEEYQVDSGNVWTALASAPAYDTMDLFTVVMHELGHVLGFDHESGRTVMEDTLSPGTRYTIDWDANFASTSPFAVKRSLGADFAEFLKIA